MPGRFWLAGLVWAAAGGCSDSVAPPEPAPDATLVTVDAEAGPLIRILKVESTLPIGVQVDYWSAATPRLRVTQASPATEHSVFLPSLRAGQVYDYEVRAAGAGLGRPPLHRGQVTTDTLPSDLAAVHFTSLGTPTERLTMVELRGSPFSGWVIVDENGAVVWYRRGIAESFTRRTNGDFVLLETQGITEVRPDLTVVAQLPATAEARMHHDVIATPANTLLFLAQASETFDGMPWVGEAIWEWSPEDATLARRWTAWDFLS